MIYKTDDIHCEIMYDGLNIIVEHKKINTDKNSKNYGKLVADGNRSYFSKASELARHLGDKVLINAIQKNIEDLTPYVNNAINEIKEEFNNKHNK